MSRTITSTERAPTEDQWRYVHGMRRKLHLSETLLNNHAIATFGRPLAQLDRRQVSVLIDQMKAWTVIPADRLREAGQRDLWPGEQS